MPVDPGTLREIALSPQEYQGIVDRLDASRTASSSASSAPSGASTAPTSTRAPSSACFRAIPPASSCPPAPRRRRRRRGRRPLRRLQDRVPQPPLGRRAFQGAATGVGGIVRDILAMGARPIALLNSLRFGPADSKRTRRLFHGIVEGISWYGNCIGVPDVGGEITFAPCYDGNPLVNAMCIGLVPPMTSCARSPPAPAICCCSSAQTPAATASTARPASRRRPWRTRRSCAPPCRWAIPSSRRCSSRPAWRRCKRAPRASPACRTSAPRASPAPPSSA